MIGIYGFKNKKENKWYIGQSVRVEQRFNQHIRNAFNSLSSSYNTKFHKELRKNYKNFEFKIIEETSIEKLNEKEIFFIEFYDSYKNGYNSNRGGSGFKKDLETISEVKKDLLENILSIEEIQKKNNISRSLIYDIRCGDAYYDDSLDYPLRKENNQRTVKRPEPLELAKLIKELGFRGTGYKFGVSDNAIKKWCKFYKIPHLKKELVSWYNDIMNIKEPKKNIQNHSNIILQLDKKTNKILNEFNSCVEAARFLGDYSYNKHINAVCNGKQGRKTAYGYKWKFK